MYSSLQIIELELLDSKSYTNILENKRFVSYRSNLGMKISRIGRSSDDRAKNRDDPR